jgi:hypothetical protein
MAICSSTYRSERNSMHLRMLSGKRETLPSGYKLFDILVRKKQHAPENAVWNERGITFWLYALRHVDQKEATCT